MKIKYDKILILDFGSQYSQLISRRVREMGVYCEIFSWNISFSEIKKFNPKGIILSGGPDSITKKDSQIVSDYIFHSSIPILGICYGMHVMVTQLGGVVRTCNLREYGYVKLFINESSILTDNISHFEGLSKNFILDVWMSHKDQVVSIPMGFRVIGSTENCKYAFIEDKKRKFYGIQFHPEVSHTNYGKNILEKFVINVCGCSVSWKSSNILNNIIDSLKKKIKDDQVILALSGGIDSLVTALLLRLSVKDKKQLIFIFIDNGLLSLDEVKNNMDLFKREFDFDVILLSKEERFLSNLLGVKDPEKKRKIIGRTFIEIFNEEALKYPNAKWLSQGTIYSDLIESSKNFGTGRPNLIKSHHNVGGIPKNMKNMGLKLLEPLKNLFKDEVRDIALQLNIPKDIIYKHPFPGPGLAIRILGEVKKDFCDLIRRSDSIFIDELKKENLYMQLSQAFSIFIPVRSVGVLGDSRIYDWVIALRAVKTFDFMTADCFEIPINILKRISSRIINEIDGISRVVYDISSKPPSTIEWE